MNKLTFLLLSKILNVVVLQCCLTFVFPAENGVFVPVLFQPLRHIPVSIIDDEQLLFLYCSYDSKNPDFPCELYLDFNLHDMVEDEYLAEFRFHKQDILVLVENLQIPQRFVCEQRSICDGLTGLCMLLERLSYPCKYGDMISISRSRHPVLVSHGNRTQAV
jgi:hypothetical protein